MAITSLCLPGWLFEENFLMTPPSPPFRWETHWVPCCGVKTKWQWLKQCLTQSLEESLFLLQFKWTSGFAFPLVKSTVIYTSEQQKRPLILWLWLKIHQNPLILSSESFEYKGGKSNELWRLWHEVSLTIVSLSNYNIPSLLMVKWDQDTDWVAVCTTTGLGNRPEKGGEQTPWYLHSLLLDPFLYWLLQLNASMTALGQSLNSGSLFHI